MSARTIIKADLQKLIPSYTESQLPSELIALSETFLAQSSNLPLNASELPAKHFLCTHLACDRLSMQLSLPDLNLSSVPIPAAKYKKLFQRVRAETRFRQVRDSGRSGIDTRRRIARDSAKEMCGRVPSVPISMVLGVLDRLVQTRSGMTDTRAMVVAVFLLCLQAIKKTKTGSGPVQASLIKEYGLRKQDVELEMNEIRRCQGKDWFDLEHVKKLNLDTQQSKQKAKITQVKMVSECPSLASSYPNELFVDMVRCIRRSTLRATNIRQSIGSGRRR